MIELITNTELFDRHYAVVKTFSSYYFISSDEELMTPTTISKNDWKQWLENNKSVHYNCLTIDEINTRFYVGFESEAEFEYAIHDDAQDVYFRLFEYLAKPLVDINDRAIHLKLCRLFQLLYGGLFIADLSPSVYDIDLTKKFHLSYTEDFRFVVNVKNELDFIYEDKFQIHAFHKHYFKEIFKTGIPLTNKLLHLDIEDKIFSSIMSAYLDEREYNIPDSVQAKLKGYTRIYKIDKLKGIDTMKSDLSMDEIKQKKKLCKHEAEPIFKHQD